MSFEKEVLRAQAYAMTLVISNCQTLCWKSSTCPQIHTLSFPTLVCFLRKLSHVASMTRIPCPFSSFKSSQNRVPEDQREGAWAQEMYSSLSLLERLLQANCTFPWKLLPPVILSSQISLSTSPLCLLELTTTPYPHFFRYRNTIRIY